MGLHPLRWRRRFLWLLDERCGGSTDEDAATEERNHSRETETEGGERVCAAARAEGGGGLAGQRERVKAGGRRREWQEGGLFALLPGHSTRAIKKPQTLVQSSRMYECRLNTTDSPRTVGES